MASPFCSRADICALVSIERDESKLAWTTSRFFLRFINQFLNCFCVAELLSFFRCFGYKLFLITLPLYFFVLVIDNIEYIAIKVIGFRLSNNGTTVKMQCAASCS